MSYNRKDDKTIEVLSQSLSLHITRQDKYEKDQSKVLKDLVKSDREMRAFIKRADPVINMLAGAITAGDLFSKFILWVFKMVLAVGGIIGAIYAIREWIIRSSTLK